MQLPNDPSGKGRIAYLLVVYLFACFSVREIIKFTTGFDIDRVQMECSASLSARYMVIGLITAIALLLHMVIGYCYFRANGEGPYGPIAKAGSPEKLARTRLLPYVSNFILLGLTIFPVMYLVIRRC